MQNPPRVSSGQPLHPTRITDHKDEHWTDNENSCDWNRTGIKSDGIGSQPTKCAALRMSDTPMLGRINTALKDRYGDRAATLRTALECHCQARHLISNPRFAACLLRRMIGFCGPPKKGVFSRFPSKEAALVALDMLLVLSAQDYKELNAMRDLDKDHVARCYKFALTVTTARCARCDRSVGRRG
ncbi:Hypothetical protein, putative [Bodo saltans]|uniref:Uncharacterized protein n=1 Tax=Bodo saltans TaxID=75058 RepID=A0A0S4J4H1_BODSA|nr:Hypothetical protein, putative [Bodo saltans]|eukprot:CUG86314.1 Hypothetical protein, putative [Bodo saltans]